MRALLLVDIQNDFLPGGTLPVPNGDQVVAIANRAQYEFVRVYATKDWHPANHGSFADNHSNRKPGEIVELGGVEQILWPRHCVQNSSGSHFAPGLETGEIDRIVYKGTDPDVDSYSAFFDNSEARATGLEEILRADGINELFVLGLATDYCVKFTVLDALRLGFQTSVVIDGCRGVDLAAGDSERACDEISAAGGLFVESYELATELARISA